MSERGFVSGRGNVTSSEIGSKIAASLRSYSRLPRFEENFLKDTTYFLFSNFPNGWSQKDLWSIFIKNSVGLGRLANVYIPNKKDMIAYNFGFARFKEVNNAFELKKKLNLIWIGSYKLLVIVVVDRRKGFLMYNDSKTVLSTPLTVSVSLSPLKYADNNLRTTKTYKQVLLNNLS
ncbi:hypothetical protein REPUB_Repub05bG0081400 [Reevesia pubescens]